MSKVIPEDIVWLQSAKNQVSSRRRTSIGAVHWLVVSVIMYIDFGVEKQVINSADTAAVARSPFLEA